MEQKTEAARWAKAIIGELADARVKFGPMADEFEGAAVLQEEVDELWHEIKHGARDRINMRAEAVQVAAMALRFLEDVCHRPLAELASWTVASWEEPHAHYGFPSPHAAYAELRAEMAKLWEAVDRRLGTGPMAVATQMVALIALRFLVAFGEEA